MRKVQTDGPRHQDHNDFSIRGGNFGLPTFMTVRPRFGRLRAVGWRARAGRRYARPWLDARLDVKGWMAQLPSPEAARPGIWHRRWRGASAARPRASLAMGDAADVQQHRALGDYRHPEPLTAACRARGRRGQRGRRPAARRFGPHRHREQLTHEPPIGACLAHRSAASIFVGDVARLPPPLAAIGDPATASRSQTPPRAARHHRTVSNSATTGSASHRRRPGASLGRPRASWVTWRRSRRPAAR